MKQTNTIKFPENGKLTILQVSDAQDLAYVRKAMVQMLDAAYDKVKPDLVLLTGDNILGNHLLDARFGSRKIAEGWAATYEYMRASLAHILNPLEKRKIPFAMIFGNHDDMNCVTKAEQADIFRMYSMSLPMNTEDESRDCATYNIPILSSDGEKTLFNIWMIDSAWYDKGEDRCYQDVKKEAVEWYNKTCGELKNSAGKVVDSLMFLHIPLPAQKMILEECSADDAGAVEMKGSYYRLDPSKANGVLGEPLSVCENDNGLFESIKANGDVMAVVTGHDHANCFDATADGVRMIQTPAASFRCYGNDYRGVRVFTLDESKPGEFETYMLHYKDLCGDSPAAKLRYIWDADDKIPQKTALIAGTAAGAAVGIAALCAAVKKLKK